MNTHSTVLDNASAEAATSAIRSFSARYRTIDKLPGESHALESTNFAFRSVSRRASRGDFHKATKSTDSYLHFNSI
jgi:hypothetical protein